MTLLPPPKLYEVELLYEVERREEVGRQYICKEMSLCLDLSMCRKVRRLDSAEYLSMQGVFLVAIRENS